MKEGPEDEIKQQSAKKRKYNKTGKYKKNTLDTVQDGGENVDVSTFLNIFFSLVGFSNFVKSIWLYPNQSQTISVLTRLVLN